MTYPQVYTAYLYTNSLEHLYILLVHVLGVHGISIGGQFRLNSSHLEREVSAMSMTDPTVEILHRETPGRKKQMQFTLSRKKIQEKKFTQTSGKKSFLKIQIEEM